MATNNFKAFGIAASANVTTQTDYESLPALLTGFTSGKASSAQINKALRQSSSMAAMLGQFLNTAGLDALDNGSLTTLLSNFTTSLSTNLSLGTAAKKNVGNSAAQIPDMSLFGSNLIQNGYTKLPNGVVIQWGYLLFSTAGQGVMTTNFNIAFPTSALAVYATDMGGTGGQAVALSCTALSTTQLRVARSTYNISSTGTIIQTTSTGLFWLAIGY